MEEQDKFHELDELDLPEKKEIVPTSGTGYKATTANSSTVGSLSN